MEKDFYSMEELNSLFNALDEHQNAAPAKTTAKQIDIPVGEDEPVAESAPAQEAELPVYGQAEPAVEPEVPVTPVMPVTPVTQAAAPAEKRVIVEPPVNKAVNNNVPAPHVQAFSTLEQAMQEYAAGDFAAAANHLAAAAVNEEDYRAARMLGDMIDFGEAANMGTAADWYVRAMAIYQMQEMEDGSDTTGYALTLYRLAICYALGNGVSKKMKRSVSMLERIGFLNLTPNELYSALLAEKLEGENDSHLRPDVEELLTLSSILLEQENKGNLVAEYVREAERQIMAGSMPDANVLGQLYYMQGNCQMYGLGCIKNANLGQAFWQEAVRFGNEDAQAALNMQQA